MAPPLRDRLAGTGIYLNDGPPHDRKRLHLRQVTPVSESKPNISEIKPDISIRG
jgi:hypothetical protein